MEPQSEIEERALFFFVKSFNTLKAVNLLFNTGNIVSARILMRSLFEIMLQTKKLIKDGEVFLNYAKAFEKFKTIEASKIAIDDPGYPFHTVKELEENVKKLKEEITELGFKPTWNENSGRPHVNKYFEIKGMAIDVNMESLYESSYKNLCMDTHTSSTHFYKYFVGNGEDTKLNLHPYLHELDLMITIVVGYISDTIDDFCNLVNISNENTANFQLKKLERICYQHMPVLVAQGFAKKNDIGLVF